MQSPMQRQGSSGACKPTRATPTAVQAFQWDAEGSAGVIVNMSVWTDVEHLAAFVFGDMHREVMRRRREWFHRMSEAYTTCWWVPAGHRPTTAEAEDRIRNLRANGPNPMCSRFATTTPIRVCARTPLQMLAEHHDGSHRHQRERQPAKHARDLAVAIGTHDRRIARDQHDEQEKWRGRDAVDDSDDHQ